MTKSWEDVLAELVDETEFKSSIDEKGFFKSDASLKIFTKKYNFQPLQNTATYLSLDFWSEQSPILRKKKFYLLRTGSGKFGIFDQTKFPKPYLELNTANSIKLDLKKNDDFLELVDAFDTRQENPGLEHLNVTGVYDSLITKLFGNMEWHIGPRGNKGSNFKVFGKTTQNEISFLYDFHGQEELDYTIWTKDHILLFEAKALEKNMGLDIGWHKLAYPASRFQKYENYKIKPIYLLKWGNITHLFVFPIFNFHNTDGIIINDKERLIPEKIFRVDFGNSLDNF
jgi:hypothetical protein